MKIKTVLTSLAISMLVCATPSFAATVVLEWTYVEPSDLTGYKCYYADTNIQPFKGTGVTQGASPVLIPKGTKTCTLSGLDSTKEHFYAVTAYNNLGMESAYSTIVTTPAWPISPGGITIKFVLQVDQLIIK